MTTRHPSSPRIVLAGSVNSSRLTLEALLRHNTELVGVLGLPIPQDEAGGSRVDLVPLAESRGVPARHFSHINDDDVFRQVVDWAPDLLMVVGLSQMVDDRLLAVPRLAPVGYHPTALPRGRGRAPIAWLAHDGGEGAATFFVMTKEADAGGILVQEAFDVPEEAYAQDVVAVQSDAIDRALDRWLPRLVAGWWDPEPQDESLATWNGRRGPADGLIDWSESADEIARQVRTASRPHPGAYTHCGGDKLIVWRARVERSLPIRGTVGRVLMVTNDQVLVQAASGLVWLEETEGPNRPRVGQRLGFVVDNELARLRDRVAMLEKLLGDMTTTGARSQPSEGRTEGRAA
tara:strand:+ start:1509 stop:2549 length:1041 start_codon:yes stop_codon:yes gene_type:complete